MSIGLAAFMPETEAADRLVISALIPCDRHSHGFQSRKGYFSRPLFILIDARELASLGSTRHRSVHFRSTPLLAPDRFLPLLTFCLLTQAVQHLPLEREAPLGGLLPAVVSSTSLRLETLPVKRIREANLNSLCSNPSQSVRSTSASCLQELSSVSHLI